MNSSFLAKNNNKVVRATNLLAGAVAFSIVLPIRANALISVLIISSYFLYTIFTKSFRVDFFKTPLFVLVCAHMIIQLFGLFHSPDLSQGYADIERYYFALALPFFIYLIKDAGVSSSDLLAAFSFGTIGLTLYGIGYSILFMEGAQQNDALRLGHSYFSDTIFTHPTYLSIYLIFIFFFLLEIGRANYLKMSKMKWFGLVLLLGYITGMLFFLRSQMSLLIFALLCVLYAIVIFKKSAWLMTFLLFTVFLIVFLLDRNRVSTFFDSYGKNVSSALDNRFKVWGGAIEAIKSAPVFGSGTGGEQIALDTGYAKTGYQEGIDSSYNAHNQYLQFLVRNGIVELVCFAILLLYSFRQSLKSSSYTFLMFNILFSLSMLTESCLSVHKGIVFFYFFLGAFTFLPYKSASQ